MIHYIFTFITLFINYFLPLLHTFTNNGDFLDHVFCLVFFELSNIKTNEL